MAPRRLCMRVDSATPRFSASCSNLLPAIILPVITLPVIVFFASCDGSRDSPGPGEVENSLSPAPALANAAPISLVDITEHVGLGFHIRRPLRRDAFMPDSMGPGCALFDADGDGDLDALIASGVQALDGSLDGPGGCNRLYLRDDRGFYRRAPRAAGLDDPGFGMGFAIGDADADGDLDVYVTNFGLDRFYRNRGDGTFVQDTERSHLGTPGWSTSAAFADFDADGDLDLYVARYLQYDPAVRGRDEAGRPEYPPPSAFPGESDVLYVNDGSGVFADASTERGIAGHPGRGLGVLCADLDSDGRLDIYVANDGEANFAWMQQEDGRFRDEALERGLAYDCLGRPEASMGIAAGDIDDDGDLDLFLTHLVQQTNTLYRQDSPGRYEDSTAASGLGAPSLDRTGFGVELDGDLDLVVVNGRVLRGPPVPRVARLSPHWRPYAEPDQVFLNEGGGRFRELLDGGVHGLTKEARVGRGLAAGDIDDDGDVDLLVSQGDGSVRLLRNDSARRGHWLGVRAVTVSADGGSVDAIGARVVVRASGRSWYREVLATRSYCSSADLRVQFGLGMHDGPVDMTITWPTGERERFGPLELDRYHRIRRGTGSPVTDSETAGR